MKSLKDYWKSFFPGTKYITVMLVPEDSDKIRTVRIKKVFILWCLGIVLFLSLFFFTQFVMYPYFISRISKLGGGVAELKNVRVRLASLEGELQNLNDLKRKFSILIGVKDDNQKTQDDLLPIASMFFKKDNSDESMPDGLPAKGFITAKFGDISSFFKYPHPGVDIVLREGTYVRATASGRVIKSNYDPVMGNMVEIEHKGGYSTRYCHLKRTLVNVNDNVEKGKIIGLSGNTGKSFGPHLHYEVLLEGKNIDPLNEGVSNVGEKR